MRGIKRSVIFLFTIMLVVSIPNVQSVSAVKDKSVRPELDVKKTIVAPIIDGSIDESMWSVDEPLSIELGEGDYQDASFGMLWDQQYLYVAIDIEDNKLVYDGKGHWYEQDSISIFLDPTLHQSSPYEENDMQIGLVYQPESMMPEFHFGGASIENHDKANENRILRAIQTTEEGWSAEVAIPWDILAFDPNLKGELGVEVQVTDRDDDEEKDDRVSAWSAFERDSFWNDTYGFGIANLVDEEVSGEINNILLDENFDELANGEMPFGWTNHAGSSDTHFEVNDGKLIFKGKADQKTARALAPVQWDNYVIEADLTFEDVVNRGRWASIMFRASANGENEYNQMAVRHDGTYEIAYRPSSGGWSVPVSGKWGQELTLNETFTLKTRVVGNNVKEYIKAKDDEEFELLVDESLDILERGKVGVQADKSDVTFDNFKVTRVSATDLTMELPEPLAEFTGPVDVNYSVEFSDGITEELSVDDVKIYSNNEAIVKIQDNKIYPIKEGTATLKAVYQNVEVEKEVQVEASDIDLSIVDLQHDVGYILASVDEAILLENIKFSASFNDLTEKEVTGQDLAWSIKDDQVEVNEAAITPKQKGVYKLRAGDDDTSTDLYLIVKKADETEYVLFEEDFESMSNSQLPEEWETNYPDKISVNDGSLFIDGTSDNFGATSVLLPKYLELFGDYKIEADMTHTEANNSGRWNSILYRIQNDSYPYYHMAVRKGTSAPNGVEFAMRTPNDDWNVIDGAPFSEDISGDKMYRYQVVTQGNRVQQYIDNMLLIDTDVATEYDKGRIGLQAAGSKTQVDNIRVTLQTEELPEVVRPGDRFAKVSEPDSKIALAPSIVTEVNNKEELQQLTEGLLPATAIFHINSNLDINNQSGNKIASLGQVIEQINQKIIPAFSIKDEATIESLVGFLKANQIEDAFVLSSDPDLVEKARKSYSIIRGIIDYSGKSVGSSLMDVRRTTNSYSSKVAILSQEDATKENVEFLQKRLMTVWVKEDTVVENDTVNMHQMITSGPNGMIVNNTNQAIEALGLYSGNTTLVRAPLMIGHRGVPALAPENTVESSVLAYEKGANVIETDLFLTKDNEVVIMHDTTLDRTTTGSGRVENHTLEELKQLKANVGWEEEYPDAKIPTLDEYFDAFKGEDTQLFLEIKSTQPEIVDRIMDSINKYNIEDQVTIISFEQEQLKLLDEKMPGMSGGFLISRPANTENMHTELRNILQIIQGMNTTYNPSRGGLDGGIDQLMEVAKHRGVTVWPWTYRLKDEFIKHFLFGTYGLTTDYNHWASDWSRAINSEEEAYELKAGEVIELEATVDTYIRKTHDITPSVIVIDGEEHIEIDGNEVTAKTAGTAYVLLRYTEEIGQSDRYDIYTQPIEITIEESDIDLTQLEELINEAETYSNEEDVYTETTFATLQDAIEQAKEDLDTIETSEELNESLEALQDAIDGLELNLSTLEQLIDEAKAYSNEEDDYTEDSFDALQEAIEEAEKALDTIENTDELIASLEALKDAIDSLELNLLALEQLIEEAKAYSNEEGDYTEDSFATLQEAIEEAEEAIATIETPEELSDSLKALQDAIAGLEIIVNGEKLEQLIEKATSYLEEDYTESSYQALLAAIEVAAEALEKNTSEDELVEAYMGLLTAIDNLVEKVTETVLEQLIEEAKTYTNVNREYTRASFNLLQESIQDAQAILEGDEITDDDLLEAFGALQEAITNLEERTNVKPLIELIEEAQFYSNDDETFTLASLKALKEAILVAENALEVVETDEELDKAISDLQTAINGLEEKVDVRALEQLIKGANKYKENQDKYTKASFKAFEEAIELAEEALTVIETDKELNEALDELQAAIDNLEEKVGITALKKLIKNAKKYGEDSDIYTKDSYKALKKAIAVAEEALATVETDEELNKALSELQTAIDNLEKVGGPSTPIPGEPEDPEENPEKESTKDPAELEDDKGIETAETDGKEEKLPKSATNSYNYILIGMILIVLSSISLLVRRKFVK